MRVDNQRALGIVGLINEVAQLTGEEIHRGYALWAEAVITSVGLGDFDRAAQIYDGAPVLFAAADDELSQATIDISRIYTLTSLGRHDEALATAARVSRRSQKARRLASPGDPEHEPGHRLEQAGS